MRFKDVLNCRDELLAGTEDLSIHELGEVIYGLTEESYKFKPVDIETFIMDPYYLGNTVGVTVFPFWVDFLKKIYPHPTLTMYNEVILSTAIGTGKTTVAIVSLLYEMYKLLALKDPFSYYDLQKGVDKFAFSIMAPTHGQGGSVAFTKFLGMVSGSEFFKEQKAVPKGRTSVSEEGILISDFMMIHTGTKMDHLLGKLNFGGMMDEVSFFQGKDALERARNIHTGFRERRKSRFIHLEPFMPGILWLVSSPLDEQDYLNEAIENMDSNPNVTYFDNIPAWEVRGKRGNYLGDTFEVYMGDERLDPFIITDQHISEDMRSRVLTVPMEYHLEFDSNIIAAIRNLAGRRVQSDCSLFKSREQLRNVFINPNRFKKDCVSMSFLDTQDKLENYATNLDYFKNPLHKNSYRFIHLDIATTGDKFGLVSVYSTLEDIVIQKPTPENINLPTITKKERLFYVDFAVAIEAKKGEEINIFKVLDFIFLLKKLGYPLRMVTSDAFQGQVTRQFLRLKGTRTEYLSVDKTKDPYYALRELVHTGRLIGVRNDLLLKELIELRDLKDKVDHLPKGSKDIADSLTGAIFACLNSKEYMTGHDVYECIAGGGKPSDIDLSHGDPMLKHVMQAAYANQRKSSMGNFFNL